MPLLRNPFKKRTEISQGIVAISFFPNGFAIAVTAYSEHNRPRLLLCDFVTALPEQWKPQLESLVKSYHLERYSCHILLTRDQYHSFSIETPQVNDDEIKAAVRWRVAEMLEYPTDRAILDYYPLPKSNRANSTPLLEVICCDGAKLDSLLQPCKQAGLNIKVVDIQEAALRNLATLLPENEQGVAVLHLQPTAGHIIIEKGGTIFLSRKFELGYNRLLAGAFGNEQQAEMEQNNLALEIQRSLDYVENYFDVPPITSLGVILMPSHTETIVNFLMINHGITARALDLSAIVSGDIILNDALQNVCAPVIGAGLRRWVEG